MGMRSQTPPVLPRTERRIRREARSATLRERAWALRQSGWTYAAIGGALGVCTTRALQIIRKAERLSREQASQTAKGAPATERPRDSDDPLAAGRNNVEQGPWIDPPLS
jgi:hypothetical protein